MFPTIASHCELAPHDYMVDGQFILSFNPRILGWANYEPLTPPASDADELALGETLTDEISAISLASRHLSQLIIYYCAIRSTSRRHSELSNYPTDIAQLSEP